MSTSTPASSCMENCWRNCSRSQLWNYSIRRRRGTIVMWLCVAVMYGTVTSHHDGARDGFIIEIKSLRKINKILNELSHYRIKNRFNASTWLSGTKLFADESHVAKRFSFARKEARTQIKVQDIASPSQGHQLRWEILNKQQRFLRRFQLSDCSTQDALPMARRSPIEIAKSLRLSTDMIYWADQKRNRFKRLEAEMMPMTHDAAPEFSFSSI